MKALALAALLPLVPAQFKADQIPPGGSICDAAQTRCIVRYDDWDRWKDNAAELDDLRKQVKTVKCASVEVLEPPKGSTGNVSKKGGSPGLEKDLSKRD